MKKTTNTTNIKLNFFFNQVSIEYQINDKNYYNTITHHKYDFDILGNIKESMFKILRITLEKYDEKLISIDNIDITKKDLQMSFSKIEFKTTFTSIKDKNRTNLIKALTKVNKIRNLDLEFDRIDDENNQDNKMIVLYYGHEVAGSYVHDYQVTPNYEKQLMLELNMPVKWTGKRYGDNLYEFEIDTTKSVYKENIFKGKRQRAYTYLTSFANLKDSFSFLYFIEKNYKQKTIDEKVLLKNIGLEIKDNNIIFDEKIIATIMPHEHITKIYKDKEIMTDSSDSIIEAEYDLFITNDELRKVFHNINKRLLNHYFKSLDYDINVTDIYEDITSYNEGYSVYSLSNKYKYKQSRVFFRKIVSLKEVKEIIDTIMTTKSIIVLENYSLNDQVCFRYRGAKDLVQKGFLQSRDSFLLLKEKLENNDIKEFQRLRNENKNIIPLNYHNRNKLEFDFSLTDLLIIKMNDETLDFLINLIYEEEIKNQFYVKTNKILSSYNYDNYEKYILYLENKGIDINKVSFLHKMRERDS